MRETETQRAGATTEGQPTDERGRRRGVESTDRESWWIRRRRTGAALGLLILVGVAFALVQSALLPPTRKPLWDEAVYISQVTPGMHGAYFNAWHARGITLIVAPITSLGASIETIRIYLMMLSAFATIAVFGLWLRLIGVSAVIAAVGFSFSWVSLASASEVMPNYWAALLGVAATAMFARWSLDNRLRQILFAAALLAGMALVRPTEASLLTAGLTAYVLLFRRHAWHDIGWLILGLVVGWAPWLVEMSIRFGGLRGAIDEAGKAEHFRQLDVMRNLVRHLTYAGGVDATTSNGGAIWWGVVLALGLVAIVRGTSTERSAATSSSLGALFLAAQYVMFVPAFTPRFLLPAYALSTIPAGIGLRSLLRGGSALRAAGVAVGLLSIPWFLWQANIAEERAPEGTYLTTASARVGATMRRLSEGRECFFLTPRAYPEIALASRCQGTRYESLPSLAGVERFARTGRDVFVVVNGRVQPGEPALQSVVPPTKVPAKPYWRVYHFSPGTLRASGT